MTIVAALPRSPLHLALLAANQPDVDHVLYRDARLEEQIERRFPGRGISLGREGRLPLSPAAAIRQFAANRAYYREVRDMLAPLGIDRLILFLEGEPLERMLADWFAGPIELWEDGLSHYVDLTGSAWYAARGAVQTASGFYHKGAMRRRADRSRMLVRDRFEARNLVLPPFRMAPAREAILYVGSPLVEDGIIGRARYAAAIEALTQASRLPLSYLPHPRQDVGEIRAMLRDLPGFTIAAQPHGLEPHVAAHGYRAFVAAISTALLDMGAFDRSLFVPRLFGLEKMHRALAGWPANPVEILRDVQCLRASLDRLAGQAAPDAAALPVGH